MKIPRIYHNLTNYLKQNKVLVGYGPRQVGKTTLIQDFLATTKLKYRLDFGDDIVTQEVIASRMTSKIREYVGQYELIVIDEAQKIPHVGDGLKLMVDQMKGIFIIATGSSSFELSGQIGEPLTGRKVTLTFYPVSQMELKALHNSYELKQNLEEYLVYGGYPEVAATRDTEEKKTHFKGNYRIIPVKRYS